MTLRKILEKWQYATKAIAIVKVIIEKSRVEDFLKEQDTIENVS